MKRSLIIFGMAIISLVVITSCTGLGTGTGTGTGTGDSESTGAVETLPTMGSSVTDAGNPVDEIETPHAYVNQEFDIRIEYTPIWQVRDEGPSQATFASSRGDTVRASFAHMPEGMTFEGYVEGTRGSNAGLGQRQVAGFDRVLCTPFAAESETPQQVECYFHRTIASGETIIKLAGTLRGREEDSPRVIAGAKTAPTDQKAMKFVPPGSSGEGEEGEGTTVKQGTIKYTVPGKQLQVQPLIKIEPKP